jgi:hypothetical protein
MYAAIDELRWVACDLCDDGLAELAMSAGGRAELVREMFERVNERSLIRGD